MGWTITIEDETQQVSKKLSQSLEIDPRILKEGDFILLKYLDPYGDTIFNWLQCRDLLADLNSLIVETGRRPVISELIKLVEEVLEERTGYVMFYGD